MTSFAVRILLAANRVLPEPALPGDADALDYARWEYRNSAPLLELYRSIGGTAPRRVLDLGCGLGGKTHRLSEEERPATVWFGLDIDLNHLRQARGYHRHVGVRGIQLIASDAGRLPFPGRCFDRIVSSDTLEHLPDPPRALREMRRCVRDEGRVVLVFNPWGSARGSHLADLLRLPWCQLFFAADTLEAAARLEAARRSARAATHDEAARIRVHAEELLHHFREHVHPTRIADLRRWLRQDRTFAIEEELRVGPGPLARSPLLRWRWLEELLSASYGAILRPLPLDGDGAATCG